MSRISIDHRDEPSSFRAGLLVTCLIFVTVLGAASPWNLRMGFVLLPLGIMMIIFPPAVRLSRPVIALSLTMLVLGLGSFLPVSLTGQPEWRNHLNDLGVETGSLVAVQARMALESHLVFVLLVLASLWLLGLRFSVRSTRTLALIFVVGVSFYAVFAKLSQGQMTLNRGGETFGFFPNRNHNSNFLCLGFLCGIGALFQSIRSKDYLQLAIFLGCSGILLWALFSWNFSRSGIVLCFVGPLLWFFGLGWRYFGRNEIRAFVLILLLGVGVFSLESFGVKDRLSDTMEKVSDGFAAEEPGLDDEAGRTGMSDLDFRIPIARDTFLLLSDFPLTGVGSGQFRWVFPQYRDLTRVANHSVALHPESSWLWIASEWGLPAMLSLLALVGYCYYRGVRNLREKGNRDRALRFGCLVASFLVPLHSLLDVPAHRPSLLLAALFLFVISQNHTPESESKSTGLSRFARFPIGGLLILAGVYLLGGAWFGWAKPQVVALDEKLANGVELYEKIKKEESPMTPLKTLPLREELIDRTGASLRDAALDGRLYRLRALASLPLSFRAKEVSNDFEIDRALTPFSFQIPLIHALAALPYQDAEVAKGWRAALERARRVDEVYGTDSAAEQRVIRSIQAVVRKAPRFKSVAAGLIGDEQAR